MFIGSSSPHSAQSQNTQPEKQKKKALNYPVTFTSISERNRCLKPCTRNQDECPFEERLKVGNHDHGPEADEALGRAAPFLSPPCVHLFIFGL